MRGGRRGAAHHGAVGRGPGVGARVLEEAGRQRWRLRDGGPGEDLPVLPHHQDLLPPPGPESRLRPGQGPLQEGGRHADPRCGPPGRPALGPGGSARPARAQAASGPGQLPALGPLPAGDLRPALPRRLQRRPARLAGQVSEPRDLGAVLRGLLNGVGGRGTPSRSLPRLQCLSIVPESKPQPARVFSVVCAPRLGLVAKGAAGAEIP
ncbi:Dynamin-3 [Manis pentadactyla]|nr:Dynamin-3 [Manis pentadactyla]